jgi:hypothetical protein
MSQHHPQLHQLMIFVIWTQSQMQVIGIGLLSELGNTLGEVKLDQTKSELIAVCMIYQSGLYEIQFSVMESLVIFLKLTEFSYRIWH